MQVGYNDRCFSTNGDSGGSGTGGDSRAREEWTSRSLLVLSKGGNGGLLLVPARSAPCRFAISRDTFSTA
ncbi:unnamed protein product [Ectocarpus sp. 4 AP-2014]